MTAHVNFYPCSLAWAEMRMILGYLLYSFDLVSLEPASKDWIGKQKIFFLWEKNPLRIRIKSRSQAP